MTRFAPLASRGGSVLDLACGGGRHTRFFRAAGHPVTAIDIDLAGVADLDGAAGTELIKADLERASWPLPGRRFAAVVVTNYLWRPLFRDILLSLAPGGLLLYESFAQGNARFGRPKNPDFLLAPGELLTLVRGQLHVVAYEHGIVEHPRPAALQRLAAVNRPADADGLVPLPAMFSSE
jgi:SAM-dependent methyltransferase